MNLEGQVLYVSGPPNSVHRAGVDSYSTGPGGTVFIRDENDITKILASYTYSLENAEFIATAFKVAKRVQEKGYDPIDALRGLPALLDIVKEYEEVDNLEDIHRIVNAAKDLTNQTQE